MYVQLHGLCVIPGILAFFAMLAPTSVGAQQVRLSAVVADSSIALGGPSLTGSYSAADARLARAMHFREAQAGLLWTEVELTAGALRLPVRAIVVKLDPRRFDLRFELLTRANGMTGAWTIDSAAPAAALALNAGQFKETGPWGWLVIRGQEERDPGVGPLSVGIVVDTAGNVRWIPYDRLRTARRDRSIAYAFQSYPSLLVEGRVPDLLRRGDVDLGHRDARLILGESYDGGLLVVLTRYDAFGGVAERVPIGLTVPEAVALAGALGARHAVMLDGGVSAQMLIRASDGRANTWKGLRRVPLGLVAIPRH